MAEIAGCSKTKSKSLVRSLVATGAITKRENYKRTDIDVHEYSVHGALIRQLHVEARKRGFLVYHNGKVCVRFANSYAVNRNPIRFKFDRAV